jgi:hypothetical protein
MVSDTRAIAKEKGRHTGRHVRTLRQPCAADKVAVLATEQAEAREYPEDDAV